MTVTLQPWQREELEQFADGEPKTLAARPNKNLIRRDLLRLAPEAGTGAYRITPAGLAALGKLESEETQMNTQTEGRAFPPALAERHGYAIGFMTTDDTVFMPIFLKAVSADEVVAVHVHGMDDADPVLRLVMRSEQFALLAST